MAPFITTPGREKIGAISGGRTEMDHPQSVVSIHRRSNSIARDAAAAVKTAPMGSTTNQKRNASLVSQSSPPVRGCCLVVIPYGGCGQRPMTQGPLKYTVNTSSGGWASRSVTVGPKVSTRPALRWRHRLHTFAPSSERDPCKTKEGRTNPNKHKASELGGEDKDKSTGRNQNSKRKNKCRDRVKGVKAMQ